MEAEVVETAVVPAGKMEFRLINPTEDGFLRRIQWNKEELEAAVRAKIAGYENVVYTEENIKAAKNDRAELNKLIKAIEERRKQVKNIINEPYAVFEAELKEITALINEPVALIDQQVKAFEEKQKEEKKAAIKATYDENIGDLAEVLPFEKIFDSHYLNQTYKLATAQKEIVDKIDTVKTDLETIDSLDSKYKLNAKDVYIKTLDLSKALAENKRLADLEEKLEADKRRKAEEEAKRDAGSVDRQHQEARTAGKPASFCFGGWQAGNHQRPPQSKERTCRRDEGNHRYCRCVRSLTKQDCGKAAGTQCNLRFRRRQYVKRNREDDR